VIDFTGITKDISARKEEVTDKLIKFSFTDVLLFWSANDEIKAVQVQKWTPILEWLGARFSLNLEKTDTLAAPKSNEDNYERFKDILLALPDKKLTVFYLAALLLKSPLLALALIDGRINADEAFDLAFLEEIEQNKRWGVDSECLSRRQQIKAELHEIAGYL
jgi:chaperone required for assembly of F1-ATPase